MVLSISCQWARELPLGQSGIHIWGALFKRKGSSFATNFSGVTIAAIFIECQMHITFDLQLPWSERTRLHNARAPDKDIHLLGFSHGQAGNNLVVITRHYHAATWISPRLTWVKRGRVWKDTDSICFCSIHGINYPTRNPRCCFWRGTRF